MNEPLHCVKNYFEAIVTMEKIYFYGLALNGDNILLFHNCIIYFDSYEDLDKNIVSLQRKNIEMLWNKFEREDINSKIQKFISVLLTKKASNNADFFKKYPNYLFIIYYQDTLSNDKFPKFAFLNLFNFDIFTFPTSPPFGPFSNFEPFYCNKYFHCFDDFYFLSCEIDTHIDFSRFQKLEYIKRKLETLLLVGNARDKIYTPYIYKLLKNGSIKEITISKKTES